MAKAKQAAPAAPPRSRISEMLEHHPDAVTVELAGRQVKFLLCPYGMKLAKRKGVDVAAVLQQGVTMESGLAEIVWAGVLPFDESLTLEEVEVMLSLRSIGSVMAAIAPALEEIAAATGGGQGNGDGASD